MLLENIEIEIRKIKNKEVKMDTTEKDKRKIFVLITSLLRASKKDRTELSSAILLLSEQLSQKNRIKFSIFSSKQGLHWIKKYSNDYHRNALKIIRIISKCIKNNTIKNKDIAYLSARDGAMYYSRQIENHFGDATNDKELYDLYSAFNAFLSIANAGFAAGDPANYVEYCRISIDDLLDSFKDCSEAEKSKITEKVIEYGVELLRKQLVIK